MTIGSDEWWKVKPARDLKLDGRWEYFTASSGTSAYSSGGYLNSDSIALTSAGRFARSGGRGIFMYDEKKLDLLVINGRSYKRK